VIVTLIVFCFIHRRKQQRKAAIGTENDEASQEKQMVDHRIAPHVSSDYDKKPELQAEPVIDPTIIGPVKSKSELRSQNSVSVRPFWRSVNAPQGETHSPEAQSLRHPQRAETSMFPAEAPNTGVNQPWQHDGGGYLPPELLSTPVSEAAVGTLTAQQLRQLKVQAGHATSEVSGSTSTAVASSAGQSLAARAMSEQEATELAEEADVIVQELGLVNLRKRALASQASAIGQTPAEVEGRKGDEYRALVDRENGLKLRLDEIENHRQGQG
jgi:hypothetical protein